MSGWLLDANVISELRKRNCHPHVRSWSERHSTSSFFLSRITIAEIRFGIEKAALSQSLRNDLEVWLEHRVRPWFAGRLLDIDEDVILTWRRMVDAGRKRNHTFSQPDLFIAATAAVHGLCVVTRNVDDFAAAGVPVLNPWIGEEPGTG